MARDAQIHIRVTEDRKEKWNEAAAESTEYQNLTHLIVSAVESELRGGSTTQPSAEQPTEPAKVDLSEVHERMDDMREEMSDLEELMEQTYAMVRQDDEIIDIATWILDTIPEVESTEEIRNRTPESDAPIDHVSEIGAGVPMMATLKNEGVDEFTIQRALDKLLHEMESVHMVEVNPDHNEEKENEHRYYKLKG